MGADFLCFVIGMPIGQEPDWDIDDKQWKEAAETWIERRGEKGETDVDDVVKHLKEQVEDVRFAWNGGYVRDAAVFERGHEKLLVTGGLSWGDDPTETFTAIQDLYDSGLIDVLGFDKSPDGGFMEKLDPLLKKVEERGLKKEADDIKTIFHQFGASRLFR